jgi:hypothetical protein
MGKAIPHQHPAVVLRSQYRQVRTMLAVAMVAVVGLSGTVVVVASEGDEPGSKASPVMFKAAPLTHAHPKEAAAGTRYDGGPEEGTRGALPSEPTFGLRPGFRPGTD